MEMKRTRKIYYKYEEWDNNLTEILNTIDCKYHIYGIDKRNKSEIIMGHICFINPRTPSKLRKTHFGKDVIFLDDNDEYDMEYYRSLNDVWESGEEMPCAKKKKPAKKEESNIVLYSEPTNKIASAIIDQNNNLIEHSKDICNFLMKQNQQLLEENKQLKIATTNTTITNNFDKIENTTNIENKTFNINVFLNEDCKNAVTLAEFLNTLKIEDADLFYAKEKGLGEAIMHVFERELNNCDINSRPLHCTDKKRETLHIKEADGWVRESGSESKRMKTAITNISNKKIAKLTDYIKRHPEFNNVSSPSYEDCLQMMRGVMGADEDKEKTEKKVLKNIAKSVYINGT